MNKNDSKKLWLNLEKEYLHDETFMLGPYTTQAYYDDPSCLAFITSRYKFCSKMLSGLNTVLEIGCGDGFGGAIVAQRVEKLICTDINEKQLEDNSSRMSHFNNIDYIYHDFREKPFGELSYDGEQLNYLGYKEWFTYLSEKIDNFKLQ